MFQLSAEKTRLALLEREPVTSGSVNVYEFRFSFSEEWDGLTKTAVFRAGDKSVSLLLDGTGEAGCTLPWEVLMVPGLRLEAGVYGTRGEEVVLPTVWADLGYIRTGAAPGEESRPPTPELWEQELARKGDRLEYDGVDLKLKSGDRILSSVEIAGGGSYTLQSKTVTPTKNQQNVTPDSGYYGLSDVTVGAIPEVYQDVSTVTAGAADVLTGKVIVDAAGKPVPGTMPNNGALSMAFDGLTETSVSIPAGYSSGGTVSLTSDIEDALSAI